MLIVLIVCVCVNCVCASCLLTVCVRIVCYLCVCYLCVCYLCVCHIKREQSEKSGNYLSKEGSPQVARVIFSHLQLRRHFQKFAEVVDRKAKVHMVA